MPFRNRNEAGVRLAFALRGYKNSDAVVYAIPRGGVPIGITIAEELDLPFDLCVTSRINGPARSEIPIAVMTEEGDIISDETKWSQADARWLEWAVVFAERDVERQHHLTENRTHIDAHNKTAIIVDEGATTGLTMRAAIRAIKAQHPKKIIIALPVASTHALRTLSHKADIVIALESTGQTYYGRSKYYQNYHPLSDREVEHMLDQYDVFKHIHAQ